MNEFWTQYGMAIVTALFWIVTLGICILKIYINLKHKDENHGRR